MKTQDNPQPGPGAAYFEKMLDRIEEIRAAERRSFQRLADIFEACSLDYSSHSPVTRQFFRSVQNRLHLAICGLTAAQVIAERANAMMPNMGLQTWRLAPAGRILKADVKVAKNYLDEAELAKLERIVGMFLDFAQHQAERHRVMAMRDWLAKLEGFLDLNDYELPALDVAPTHAQAELVAAEEYGKWLLLHDHALVRVHRRLSA